MATKMVHVFIKQSSTPCSSSQLPTFSRSPTSTHHKKGSRLSTLSPNLPKRKKTKPTTSKPCPIKWLPTAHMHLPSRVHLKSKSTTTWILCNQNPSSSLPLKILQFRSSLCYFSSSLCICTCICTTGSTAVARKYSLSSTCKILVLSWLMYY